METTLPTQPHEIVEFVIDHLHDDPATLKICALVARSWAPRSQEWLFHEVTLDSPERWDRLLDVLAISQSPVCSYIRQVMISYSRPDRIAAEKAGALFSRVHELHFMNVAMDCPLICHLTRLDALVLHWCNQILSDTSYTLKCPPSIKRLNVVQDVSFMDVVDWLDMFTNLDSLREFSLSLSIKNHFPRAVHFITSHPSITNMSLYFSIWIEYSDLMNRMSILEIRHLHTKISLNRSSRAGYAEPLQFGYRLRRQRGDCPLSLRITADRRSSQPRPHIDSVRIFRSPGAIRAAGFSAYARHGLVHSGRSCVATASSGDCVSFYSRSGRWRQAL
jgi:hypothetical protein